METLVIKNESDLLKFARDWKRQEIIPKDVLDIASEIIEEVKNYGDDALIKYTKRFDSIDLREIGLEISAEEIEAAYNKSKEIIPTLEYVAKRIEAFHRRMLPRDWFITDEIGNLLGQRITPLERIGIYCPGGRAVYPSTVMMSAIPAKIAGVKEIVMAVPTPKGYISPAILAAAKIVGINRVFRLGGAQAIAALAFGTETVPKVDFICGPGNIYVAAAKKLVFGQVGIDMIAGPSEIAIISDGTAPPSWVAADLLSQAEHDEMAMPIFVTISETHAKDVSEEINRQLPTLPRRAIAEEALRKNGYMFILPNLDMAAEVINIIAPEHLELLVTEPMSLVGKIRHAGAIFLGRYATEPIGDYVAGPNHILPTSGTARFSSVLSVEQFIKRSSIIFISKEGLDILGPRAIEMAHIEGLLAHAESIKKRLQSKD